MPKFRDPVKQVEAQVGVELWKWQREVLRDIIEGRTREAWLWLGRRSGKSLLIAVAIIVNLLLSPELDKGFVMPGETRWAVVIGDRHDHALLVHDTVVRLVENSKLASMLESVTTTQVRFTGNRALVCLSSEAAGARARGVSFFALEEAGHFVETGDRETDGPRSARKVFEAAAPAMAQFGTKGTRIIASNGAGPWGFFYDNVTALENGGGGKHTKLYRVPTPEANPTLDAEWLEEEEARDPEVFATEYLCQWALGTSTLIDFARIAEKPAGGVITADGRSLAAPVVIGFDSVTGSGYDRAGIAVTARDPDNPQRIVVALVEGLKPAATGSYDGDAIERNHVLDHVAELAKEYADEDGACAEISIDAMQANQIKNYLMKRHGIEERKVTVVANSPENKRTMYVSLRDGLYSGGLIIPDDKALLADLRTVKNRQTDRGMAIHVPRTKGGHGDRGDALALAIFRQSQLGAGAGMKQTVPNNGREQISEHGCGTAETGSHELKPLHGW